MVFLANQSQTAPATIIWATGFVNDFSWINIDGAVVNGNPVHVRGASPISGLYYIGLPFLYSKGSAFLGFVASDARHVANAVTRTVM